MNFIHSVLLVQEEKTFAEKWEMEEKERLLDLEETPQQMNTTKQQYGEHRSMNLSFREKLRLQQQESERKGNILVVDNFFNSTIKVIRKINSQVVQNNVKKGHDTGCDNG